MNCFSKGNDRIIPAGHIQRNPPAQPTCDGHVPWPEPRTLGQKPGFTTQRKCCFGQKCRLSVTDLVPTDLHGLRATVGRTESRRRVNTSEETSLCTRTRVGARDAHTDLRRPVLLCHTTLWRSRPGRGEKDRGGYLATHVGPGPRPQHRRPQEALPRLWGEH